MDESIGWVGFFTSVHGLLPIVYRIWFEKITGRKAPNISTTSSVGGASDFACILDAERVVEGVGGNDAEPDPSTGAQASAPVDQPNVDALPTVEDRRSVEDNQKDRAAALQFFRSPVLLPSSLRFAW